MPNTKEHITSPQNSPFGGRGAGLFIHLQGRVQGVGFRPFVYQLAKKMQIKGWVNNTVEGVKIAAYGDTQTLEDFYKRLLSEAPNLAKITSHTAQSIDCEDFTDFNIIESESEGKPNLLISPDFALCQNCKIELTDPHNRRKDYAFITCTQCGPRYSILQSLPYDREKTTMQDFEMCPTCAAEYQNINDRRYYSQTNSCQVCGIQIQLFEATKNEIKFEKQHEYIDFIKQKITAGKIIALKGIGGYLLLTDATSEQAIWKLRKRKNRPTKPFAVLYPDAEFLAKEVFLNQEALSHLESETSPIVLLPFRENNSLAIKAIAPNLDKIGVMLPYAPLLALLAEGFQKPLIATSANISNAPIIYQDTEALEKLGSIADFILTHNREIVFPQDDSVIQLSDVHQTPIVLRRARGFAPTFLYEKMPNAEECILAMGAMLKSSFTIQHAGNLYVSQYLGDLDNFDTQNHFQNTLKKLSQLLKAEPSIILKDAHPQYPTSEWANEWAKLSQVRVESIQHHEAHFGAVLAENHLLESDVPILGIIWDGTGYGTDGNIWGGEFFIYQNFSFERIGNIGEFSHILGDKMAREPRISALAFCQEIPEAKALLQAKFSTIEWQNYSQLLAKSSLKTSSMGRLFDAVASLVGLGDTQSYEGETALYLEVLARKYIKKNGFKPLKSYLENTSSTTNLTQIILQNIIKDLKNNREKEEIAATFHQSLVDLIHQKANTAQIKHIAFSGGVFQNSLLIDLLKEHLSKEFSLYFHQQLSPNDECISLGQWACYQVIEQKKTYNIYKKNKLKKLCV